MAPREASKHLIAAMEAVREVPGGALLIMNYEKFGGQGLSEADVGGPRY